MRSDPSEGHVIALGASLPVPSGADTLSILPREVSSQTTVLLHSQPYLLAHRLCKGRHGCYIVLLPVTERDFRGLFHPNSGDPTKLDCIHLHLLIRVFRGFVGR